ncbi:MAG: ABC transporter permease, partial [Muribaculaceae bacterium]|nr:ABC transporter permease [Muribaculaceae bacterium]
MKSKIGIIIRREYMERVSKKSFLIVTILMPLFMLAMMVLPVLIMEFSTSEIKTVAVVDSSGLIAPKLQNDSEIKFIATDAPSDSLKKLGDYFGVLTIDADIMTRPTGVRLFCSEATSMSVESNICSQMNKIIEEEKLKSYNIENLDSILDDVRTKVVLQTFRTDKSETEEAQSSMVSYAIGTIMM